ncbi:WD40 repeat-like protein [Multifurca ochricompacta]|uniref:WD40 repeat-like protein n=1 Tax=Multifurca ochricompacta TaxID=376703 RepID=A0AAD4QJI4_9AGAM|nr:WD40 repeat-like protein [Multifurca ochricompacta]
MAPPNSTNGVVSLPLTNALMTKLKPAKIFKAAVEPAPPPPTGSRTLAQQRHITGLCFDDRGDQLITAAEDETFRLYNCKTGKLTKTLHSKKYGVDLPRFTHKNTAIIYASTKEDDTIRYHSLHDNKYLQYFKGHNQRVISLEMSPVDDGFMSGSMDKSAPFLTIALEDPTLARVSFPPRAIYMTSMAFSSSGKYLLVGCSGDAHYIVDAFEGHVLAKLEGHIGLERRRLDTPISIEPQRGCSVEEVSWTPDSKYVVGGGLDGRICVWDVQNIPAREGPVDLQLAPMRIQPLAKMDGHPGPARCVRFNPRLAMMATAGAELAFWIPDQTADADEVAKELLRKAGT